MKNLKNVLDKCYANDELVEFVMQKTIEDLPLDDLTEIWECAAGDGAFIEPIKYLTNELEIPYKFSDIAPDHPEVRYGDFLKDNIAYKKGRLIITGPPYANNGWYRFAERASRVADYVVFISPNSVLDLKHPVPGLELISQYDRGKLLFRGNPERGGKDKIVGTCVMIYKKIDPNANIIEDLNKDFKINYIKKTNRNAFDYYICAYGYNAGEVSVDKNTFSESIAIKIKNRSLLPKVRDFVLDFKDNYYDEIVKYSVTAPNISIKRFREWFKDEIYS